MTKTIRHQFSFAHPPEAVWAYLTKAELLAQWLMENDFLPILGHDFQFRTRPMPGFNFDGIIYCKVVEIVPFKKLAYSWKGGPGEGKITLDSLVEWTLQPNQNGTDLLLVHSGFKEADFSMYSIMNDGWLRNIHKIDARLNATTDGPTND